MTKKHTHIPYDGRLYSRIDGYKLPELLDEFRSKHQHLFHNEHGLGAAMVFDRIPDYLDDHTLAIHPTCWKWLTERIGSSAGLVIAHWIIDTRNYAAAHKFCDWAAAEQTFCRALGVMQIREWIAGESAKSNQNREIHSEQLTPKPISNARLDMWEIAKKRYPDWASGKVDRLPFGFAKEMAYTFDTSEDSVRKMLKRERERNKS